MSADKHNHPQNDATTRAEQKHREKEITNRHVYVEPGVQIDFVQDLRKKYDVNQEKSNANSTRQLRWTIIGAVLVLIYALITAYQAYLIRDNFRTGQRAWVGVSKPITVTAIQWNGEHSIATYQTITKNYGISVATHINGYSQVVMNPGEMIPKQDELCKSAAAGTHTYTLYNGVKLPIAFGSVLYPSEETANWASPPAQAFKDNGGKLFFLVGCICYVDEFGVNRETRTAHWFNSFDGEDIHAAKFPIILYEFPGLNDSK
jgi:hypothetical protein